VARANGVPNITETRNYVKQITEMYWNHAPAKISASRPTISSTAPVRLSASAASANNSFIRTYRAPNGVLMISDQ